MRYRLVSVLALAGALLVTGVALAAQPVKGATYKGTWGPAADHNSMTFKVSSNGKTVSNFRLNGLPVGCQGGGFGSPISKSGPVSNSGTFKVTMPLYFSPTHRTTGSLVMTGTFLSGGKEKGTLSTKFSSSSSCNKTQSYTASKT